MRRWVLYGSAVALLLILLPWTLANNSCGDCQLHWKKASEDASGCRGDCMEGLCKYLMTLDAECIGNQAQECAGTYPGDGPAHEYQSGCFPTQGMGCRCQDGGIRTGNVKWVRANYCEPCPKPL